MLAVYLQEVVDTFINNIKQPIVFNNHDIMHLFRAHARWHICELHNERFRSPAVVSLVELNSEQTVFGLTKMTSFSYCGQTGLKRPFVSFKDDLFQRNFLYITSLIIHFIM